MPHMLDVNTLKAEDLQGLSRSAMAELAAAMLAQLAAKNEQLDEAARQIAERDKAIKFKDAKLERITFELARLKAWKFSAKTEAMSAEQRRLFEETLVEDQADLEAQLRALQGDAARGVPPAGDDKRKPRRQALPEHLRCSTRRKCSGNA